MGIDTKEIIRNFVKDITEEKLENICNELKKESEATMFFTIDDILDTLLKFLDTDNFKTMVRCVDGSSKEATFRAGIMMVPSILCAYGRKYYLNIPKNDSNEK